MRGGRPMNRPRPSVVANPSNMAPPRGPVQIMRRAPAPQTAGEPSPQMPPPVQPQSTASNHGARTAYVQPRHRQPDLVAQPESKPIPRRRSPDPLAPHADVTKFATQLIKVDQSWGNESAIAAAVVGTSTETDFLVIGCIGAQGTGKSTLMSMMARNKADDMFREYVFRPCAKEGIELGRHQTNGVQVFKDAYGNIFLDTQPLLSQSVLDDANNHNRRFTHDFKTLENSVEFESLQLITFMLSVCHVLIVTDDRMLDLAHAQLVQQAVHARPKVHVRLGGDEKASVTTSSHLPPTIVFVQQRCRQRADYERHNLVRRAKFSAALLHKKGATNGKSGVSWLSYVERREEMARDEHEIESDDSIARAMHRQINYFPIGVMQWRTRDDSVTVRHVEKTQVGQSATPEWLRGVGLPVDGVMTSQLRQCISMGMRKAGETLANQQPGSSIGVGEEGRQVLAQVARLPVEPTVGEITLPDTQSMALGQLTPGIHPESQVGHASRPSLLDASSTYVKDETPPPIPAYATSIEQLRLMLLMQKPFDLVRGTRLTHATWLSYARRVWTHVTQDVKSPMGYRAIKTFHKYVP